MSLTINTHPDKQVINAPDFNVTTSLTEGSSFQNLRIRATIYIGGKTSAVAVLEQPKGVSDWDFFELLRSFTGKCNTAVGGSDYAIQPGISSELLTAWGQFEGDFFTFNVSGREIQSAITTGSNDYAESNDLGSAAVGNIYVIGIESDFLDTGANKAELVFSVGNPNSNEPRQQYSGLSSGELIPNNIYFFFVRTIDTTPKLYIGNDIAGTNFSGTFSVHKITDFKNNPGVYFTVKFEEVYENASDVTVVTGEKYSDTLLFIPAVVRPGEDFETDFLANGANGFELSRTEAADSLYRFGIGMEKRMMFATTSVYTRVSIILDAGTAIENNIPSTGWGIVLINDNIGSIDAEDETIGVSVSSVINGGAILYTVFGLNINTELNCYPDFVAISFIGALGEETYLFRGLSSLSGGSQKSFYRDSNNIRKVLSTSKSKLQTLQTLVESEAAYRLLHELIYTDQDVWIYDSDFTDNYKDVTVITDTLPIKDRDELLINDIEVEYYE